MPILWRPDDDARPPTETAVIAGWCVLVVWVVGLGWLWLLPS